MIKHLHGRGEDHQKEPLPSHLTETPPRTWRRLALKLPAAQTDGNTSTDVEKTHEG